MRSAALAELRARGVTAFPVLQIPLVARGLALRTIVASPQARSTAIGGITHVTQPGGWDRIKYGSGIKDQNLKAVETSVGISDPDGELLSTLETYDPRGSTARIDFAAPGLPMADWEPAFTGVLSDWGRDGLYTKLYLKTDDTVLRTPVPAGVFNRTEWGSASEGTIFGTAMPLVTGVHDSWQVTSRGMVPAVNIRYDKDLGYWWLASVDQLVEITRLYFDGIPQGTAGWSVLRGVYGGNRCTIISIAEGSQPAKGVVVAFDSKGPNELGLSAPLTTLTGAPDTLRAIINEYGYRRNPLNGWRSDTSVIAAASWDAVSEFFALHKLEAARRFGGDQDPETVAEVIDSFLEAYPWVRIWWNELGQLDICVIDPDDVDPSDAWLDLSKYHRDGLVPFEPGDTREVYTHLKMPFMWSPAEQKFMSAYEAHDVAALPEKVMLVIDNPWSQGRFDEAASYNPAPPVDPTPPLFRLTLTGTGYANANLWLVPVGDWNPNDPLDRVSGSNTRTASGGVIQLDSSDPDWGGTFDLLIWGGTYQYGALEQSIVIEPTALTVDLEWPKLSPVAVNGITKTAGQTFTMAEAFAANPPAKAGIKGRIYDSSGPTLLLEDTWNGSAWGGAVSDPLSIGFFLIDCWWFDEAWGDYAGNYISVT